MRSEQNLKYAIDAAPIAWYEVAKLLHENAITLYDTREKSKIMYSSHAEGVFKSRSTVNRSVFLLAGFAMENILKAFLIYENPKFIKGGKLSNEVKSHKLSELQQKCEKVPYKKRYNTLFQTLESGLNSWARYPCPLNINMNNYELNISDELWTRYLKAFSIYSTRLENLLSKEWMGPYGEISYCSFE